MDVLNISDSRPYRIKTGIICDHCGWDDSREFDMTGYLEYVCPKCSLSWIVKKEKAIDIPKIGA